MKQNIKRVLLACMVSCLLLLSACGSKAKDVADSSSVDPVIAASLQQQAVTFLEELVTIPDEQMGMVISQNREAGAEGFAAGLENYLSVKEELGAYVSSESGAVNAIEDGFEIIINATFEQRQTTFEMTLDKNMTNITSMTFNPEYSIGEKMENAVLNMILGMGTVFLVLIFISLLIGGFSYINKWEEAQKAKDNKTETPAPAVPVAEAAKAQDENLVDDLELVAVITAAIAAAGNTSADGLVVRSIRRAPASRWKKA